MDNDEAESANAGAGTPLRATPSTGSGSSSRPRSIAMPEPPSASGRSLSQTASKDTDSPSGPHGPLSPNVHDRVFPVRSVVSVDPSSTPRYELADSFPGMNPGSAIPASVTARYNEPGRRSSNTSVSSRSTDQQEPRTTSKRNTSFAQREEQPRGRPVSGTTYAGVEDNHIRTVAQPVQIRSDDASVRSSSPHTAASAPRSTSATHSVRSADDLGGVLTARFNHVVSEGGHAVITGRDGDVLQRCEDEPIHIPGAIQGYGMLIAMVELPDGKFLVKVVSENSKRLIGYTPRQLFALESFTDIMSEEQADNLLDHIEFIKEGEADTEVDGPEVFTLSIRNPTTKKSQKLWCAVHMTHSNADLIICEFELEDDVQNPLVPTEEGGAELPEDTLQSRPTADELAESTVNASKPLRVLRSARKKKGEAAAMEIFNIMSQIETQLAAATRLDTFLKILIGVVKELTGFHRVMIYQFDHEFNGRVVTELVDPRATKDLYKGLNFPASDIPKQARDLYKINKVRLLYDRDQETARLVCRDVQDLETPLDLTHSHLRAMSPIHLKYLANMAVRSSMSISINAFNELWGLIACHAYGSRGMRVSFPIRKMCRLVGDIASRNIERLSYASRLQARKLINTIPTKENPSGYIVASSEDLLTLFDADCGMLSIREETKILGKLENTQEALALLEYFRLRRVSAVLTSQDIRSDFPDLRYPPGFTAIAGLLLVPLSSAGADFIVFFRNPQVKEVKWAGNPYEKFIKQGTEGYLEPRKSFKVWSETVVGKCREWTEEQVETAAVLCLVYGKFIEVWRQKEVAVQNSQLTRLLLANSAHEVRTPLNAIINYLEIALEGSLDQETRDNLSRSHSASKSLIYVINDLLDLTKTEEGKQVIKDDAFDLLETVQEATEPFKGDAKRKQIGYEVIQKPGVPRSVIGDQRRVRQAISNVVANAIQHTNEGSVIVELWLAGKEGTRVEIDIVVQDTGVGMSSSKLDELFSEMEQVQTQANDTLPDLLTADSSTVAEDKNDRQTLGYGLALVSRIVRNMNGQLRLKSEEGKGSRFVIQLSFELPDPPVDAGTIEAPKESNPAREQNEPVTPPVTDGEVMLVTKSAQRPGRPSSNLTRSRRQSQDSFASAKSGKSVKSLGSFKSGSSTRSDVDRLIDAIQEPHLAERAVSIRSAKERDPPVPKSGNSSSRPGSARPGSTEVIVASPEPADRQLERDVRATGQALVQDQGTPVRPVRLNSEADVDPPSHSRHKSTASLVPPPQPSLSAPERQLERAETVNSDNLSVLVAEDDLVNSKIIQKRLQRLGHTVRLTVNGEECASAFGENSAGYDVVLMDMQVRRPLFVPVLRV